MARETAAQKLARQEAERAAAEAEREGDPPAPPVEQPKVPVEAPYTLFGEEAQGDFEQTPTVVWVPLGEVKAPTYTHAMELAKDRMRDRILARAAAAEEAVPNTLKITVAAIASRNWNQGTAIIESRPVTTWEK